MTPSLLQQARMGAVVNFGSWRQRLLSPNSLAKLAKELGIGWFSAEDITGLWKLGLLRADLVVSDVPFYDAGLISIEAKNDDQAYRYCDFREIKVYEKGLGSALKDHQEGSLGDELAFHPFRVYVLHHIERTLKISTSNMQFLRYEPGVHSVVKTLLESSIRWTSSTSFADRFNYWNRIAETSAVVEPITYDFVFRDRVPSPDLSQLPKGFELTLRDLLIEIGKTSLSEMRSDLAFAAVTLDENRSIHVLLRLMKWREREKLKGHIGASMHFLAMAESIRRAAERAFNEPWPEEDEIGPGQWMDGARKILYGSDRVFDGPRSDLRDYLNQLGLDFGIKVRCYVEGDTEFGALAHAVGSFDHVQLINLSGNFAERRGKGLAFAKSLEADKIAGIFSIVVLDGDLEGYLRILRGAADEERFHGRFFISKPDIECGNFSAIELIESAIRECEQTCVNPINFNEIKTAMMAEASGIRTNGDLISLSKRNGLTQLSKGESWGKTLMELAIAHPNFPLGDARAGQQRPIVEVAELLIRIRQVGFYRSIGFEKVNSTDGKMVRLNLDE